MPNPSYRIIGDPDADILIIEETFDLTIPCPAIIIDLHTMLRRFDVKSVVRRIRMTRQEAEQRGIGYAGG